MSRASQLARLLVAGDAERERLYLHSAEYRANVDRLAAWADLIAGAEARAAAEEKDRRAAAVAAHERAPRWTGGGPALSHPTPTLP